MGMSSHIVGFRPPDATWESMKRVWDSCTAAGIDPPEEVDAFFDGEPPDDAGVAVDLEDHVCCSGYTADMQDGYEIDVSKLPKGIKYVRFYNSY